MWPYLVAFSLPVVLYPLRRKNRTVFVFVLSAAWALFAGARLGIGGSDYYVYEGFYASISGISIGQPFYFEPLFRYLGIACKALGLSYHGFLLILGILGILPAVYVIDKRCKDSALALFYYGMEWMLYASFVILRQSVALGLACIALDALFEKKRIVFLCLAIIAGFFHNSAFVLLPLVFFDRELKPWVRSSLFVVVGVGFLVLEGGAKVLNYSIYHGIVAHFLGFFLGPSFEPLNPFNILEILVFSFLILRYATDAPPLERNLYFLYVCVAVLSLGHAVTIRFGYYYELGFAFLLPRISSSTKASSFEQLLLPAGIMAYALAKVCRWLILNGGGNGGFLPYRMIFG